MEYWCLPHPCAPLSFVSPGSLQLFPWPNKIAIHFLYKSPAHLFGLVMGGQLSHCFPYEVANNLLCGPQHLWDRTNIWTGESKRDGEPKPKDEHRDFPSGTQTRMKMMSGASDANHQCRSVTQMMPATN